MKIEEVEKLIRSVAKKEIKETPCALLQEDSNTKRPINLSEDFAAGVESGEILGIHRLEVAIIEALSGMVEDQTPNDEVEADREEEE